jgi:hypothetical protein
MEGLEIFLFRDRWQFNECDASIPLLEKLNYTKKAIS